MDLSNPDGRGSVGITGVTINEDCTTYNFEGPVEGYGTAFITQHWRAIDPEKTRVTMSRRARILSVDRTLVASQLLGSLKRTGSRAELFFSECVSTGVMYLVK